MEKAIQGEMRLTSKRIARMMVKNRAKYDLTKKYADMFLTTIRPLRFCLLIQGQFPFTVEEGDETPKAFIGRWDTAMNAFYLFFFTLGVLNFLAVTVGYFTFFIPVFSEMSPTQIQVYQEDVNDLGREIRVLKDWEKQIIQENFSLLLVVYLWMLFLMLMNVTIFLRRRAYLNYLNYWLYSFQMMQMDIPENVFFKMLTEILLAVTVVCVLLILCLGNLMPSVSGMMDVTTFLYLRPLHYFKNIPVPKAILDKDTTELMFYIYKIPGTMVLAAAYLGTRSTTIHFIFFNRLLAGISKIWTQRMRDGLEQNEVLAGKRKAPDHPKVRIDLRFLLDDHFNIVQLYKMTEDLFGYQLIAYYFLETLGMIFELYHLVSIYSPEKVIDERYGEMVGEARTEGIFRMRLGLRLTDEDNQKAAADFYLALGATFLTFIYVFITTDCANAAYVEGMSGFQVLRRNCYLGSCDTTQERNFIHTLIVSYAPNNPIQISANGFFDINRSLVGAVMLNVLGYLVACYTLKPDTSEFWNFGQYLNLCRPKHPKVTCPP